eukprot:365395-Chlamydomonas_euryale.AAC.5
MTAVDSCRRSAELAGSCGDGHSGRGDRISAASRGDGGGGGEMQRAWRPAAAAAAAAAVDDAEGDCEGASARAEPPRRGMPPAGSGRGDSLEA